MTPDPAAEDSQGHGPDVAPAAPATGKTKKKARKAAPELPAEKVPAEPRVKWSHKEDALLDEAWKTVSLDAIVGANQCMDNYWKRVQTSYDERRIVDPEFSRCLARGQKAMANHWAVIQQACKKWHGIRRRSRTGRRAAPTSKMRYVFRRFFASLVVRRLADRLFLQFVRMMEMYRDDEKADFKLLHVFTRIQGCEKWAACRQGIRKAKEYVPDAVVAGASKGRPDGHKKAKAARDAAPAVTKLAASIESCIADVATNAAKRAKQTDARWAELMADTSKTYVLFRTLLLLFYL